MHLQQLGKANFQYKKHFSGKNILGTHWKRLKSRFQWVPTTYVYFKEKQTNGCPSYLELCSNQVDATKLVTVLEYALYRPILN